MSWCRKWISPRFPPGHVSSVTGSKVVDCDSHTMHGNEQPAPVTELHAPLHVAFPFIAGSGAKFTGCAMGKSVGAASASTTQIESRRPTGRNGISSSTPVLNPNSSRFVSVDVGRIRVKLKPVEKNPTLASQLMMEPALTTPSLSHLLSTAKPAAWASWLKNSRATVKAHNT